MHRHAILTTAVLTAAVALTATACGNAGEEGIEQLIERETGEDVELDLDADGGFSVETEEGSFSIDADGNVAIEGQDGEVTTGNIDVEDGSVSIEGEDGEEFNMSSDEGSLPDDWPAEVPVPEGLEITSGSSISAGDEQLVSVLGEASDGPAWIADYGAALESAGFTETERFSANDDEFVTYEGAGWTVGVSSSDVGGTWQVFVNVTARPG